MPLEILLTLHRKSPGGCYLCKRGEKVVLVHAVLQTGSCDPRLVQLQQQQA